jgi:hypothetical protein
LAQNKIGLSQMTYLLNLSLPTYLPRPDYLPTDLNAMCQHLIGLKLNDLNKMNKNIKYPNILKFPHVH